MGKEVEEVSDYYSAYNDNEWLIETLSLALASRRAELERMRVGVSELEQRIEKLKEARG